MVVVVTVRVNQTEVWLLVDWSGFSNFEYRNCQMEHSLVVYPD